MTYMVAFWRLIYMYDGFWRFLMNALAITNTAGTPKRRTPSELIRIDRVRRLVST